jgi:hypothetical protein
MTDLKDRRRENKKKKLESGSRRIIRPMILAKVTPTHSTMLRTLRTVC